MSDLEETGEEAGEDESLLTIARAAAMRALPGSVVRTLVSIGAPLSRFGGITPQSALALRQALVILMTPPRKGRRDHLLTQQEIAKRVGATAAEFARWVNAGLLGEPEEAGPPPRWGRRGSDRAELVAFLRQRKISEKAIEAAHADNRLPLMVVDETLVRGGSLSIGEAAKRAGVPLDLTKRIWRALGLPPPEPSDRLFTRRDVGVLRLIGVLRSVYSDDSLIETAAVMGRSMARYASAEVEMFRRELVQPFMNAGSGEVEIAWRLANLVDLTIPPSAALMETVHRWHLDVAMRSESVVRIEEAGGALPGQVELAVAFADLVGFTAASDYLSAMEVGDVATSFMRCAEDTLPDSGARIVKGIGDAVMFTAPDPVTAAASAHALVQAASKDGNLPSIRVGVAYGPVLRRSADYFGRTVNLASRLSAAAAPGTVLVAEPDNLPSESAWKQKDCGSRAGAGSRCGVSPRRSACSRWRAPRPTGPGESASRSPAEAVRVSLPGGRPPRLGWRGA